MFPEQGDCSFLADLIQSDSGIVIQLYHDKQQFNRYDYNVKKIMYCTQ